jgi:hypothetical protein
MRAIRPGEEVCFDYGMIMHSNAQSASQWTMKCRCGAPNCRGLLTEDDWQLPDLQARYNGFFAWHLQRKIDRTPRGATVSHGHRSGWNWIDDRLHTRESPHGGRGLFTTTPIGAGSIVVVLGGRVRGIEDESGDHAIQIAKDHVFGPPVDECSDADRINHSCEANLGFDGQLSLVTLRDVSPGEELCFDYATCVGGPRPYTMPCRCGTPACRGQVTHEDWLIPAVQQRYAGSFQWYLARSIESEAGNRVI